MTQETIGYLIIAELGFITILGVYWVFRLANRWINQAEENEKKTRGK